MFVKEGTEKFVTLETFQTLLYWFGPFENSVKQTTNTLTATTTTTTITKTGSTTKSHFLSNMQQLFEQDWFWHEKPNLQNGEFVVRVNYGSSKSTSKAPFVISYIGGGEHLHTRVFFTPSKKGFSVGEEKYIKSITTENLNLIELVTKLQEQKEVFKKAKPNESVFGKMTQDIPHKYTQNKPLKKIIDM